MILPTMHDYRKAMRLCRIPDKNYTRPALLMFLIFERPADFPDKYVARLYDTHKRTSFCTLSDTLEQARESIPRGLTRIERGCFDPKELVETWY